MPNSLQPQRHDPINSSGSWRDAPRKVDNREPHHEIGTSLIKFVMLALRSHLRMVGALMMRELVTRFGREGLGLLWIILEPLAFCFGVLALWSLIKPPYEHGIKLGPFVMTGYMSLILMRHIISQNINAVQANVGIFYHRQIKAIHIYAARTFIEFGSVTLAFIVVYVALALSSQVNFPSNIMMVYIGWLAVAWMSVGLSLIISALALRFEAVHRLSGLFMYLLIPLSGAFFMISFLPPSTQKIMMLVPMPHGVEMLRSGVFGEFVPTHYVIWYPFLWGSIFIVFGLLLVRLFSDRVSFE
jgi:capsular polysaccharide transport system permease protein